MSLKIPSPSGIPPEIDRAFDEIIAPLQAWADKEAGGKGWTALAKSDLQGLRGDAGVTFTVADSLSISTVKGHLKFIRFGRLVAVSFNLGLTPSAVTGQIDILIPQFGVVGRSHTVGYDSNGNALSVTLGTPSEVLGVTTIPATTAVLHFEKLSGADFAASAQALQGQIVAEISELETFIT